MAGQIADEIGFESIAYEFYVQVQLGWGQKTFIYFVGSRYFQFMKSRYQLLKISSKRYYSLLER
jgi:hypothetical protein